MLFLGLDLAWGAKNTSGGCVLSGAGQVLDVAEDLAGDDDILAWVRRWDAAGGAAGLLLGVDAPLRVPNEAGERPCEGEIRRRFARYQAGAHPANRRRFGGDVRGERLVARLADLGIAHDPVLTMRRAADPRRVLEVFPHPAHILLFGLARTLKYKAKPGRDYAGRWGAFHEYAGHIRALATHDPPLRLPRGWPPADVTGVRGGALKRYEDGLDAFTCAYIVYWYWWHGPAGAEVIGDAAAGCIVVPAIPPEL